MRLGLLGARGRLGQAIQQVLPLFSGSLELKATPARGEALFEAFRDVDVIVEVASPEAFLELWHQARGESLPPCLIGSTGWTEDQWKILQACAASPQAALLKAPHFSLGVALLHEWARTQGPLLERLGYQPVLEEVHHLHKKDRPSGTALSLQSTLAPDQPDRIPCRSERRAEVIGEHSVIWEAPYETLVWKHEAKDRRLFAEGALRLSLWFPQWVKAQEAEGVRQYRLFSPRDFLVSTLPSSFFPLP